VIDTWYRYRDYRVAPYINEFGENVGRSKTEIALEAFRVIKHTPKGVQLDIDNETRFVRINSNKRFACPTIKEAKISFVARKKRQFKILKAQIESVKEALEKAEGLKEDG